MHHGREALEAILGRAASIDALKLKVRRMASSRAPVLITGESGTGKELVARALHACSPRRGGPLVPVNCASFGGPLADSELFGHERGAFTGAVRRRAGRFASADGGTLFLDELGELPLDTQAKLLRVLQEGAYERVGSDASTRVDVRIVAATHRDLEAAVADGSFRQDLYYRLAVLRIDVPPLRERVADIPTLVAHFLARHGREVDSIDARASMALKRYAWPGNVRELDHAVHQAVVLAGDEPLGLEHLPARIRGAEVPTRPPDPLELVVGRAERAHLLDALRYCGGNRTRTADVLGISRKCLWQKIRVHRITDAEYRLPG